MARISPNAEDGEVNLPRDPTRTWCPAMLSADSPRFFEDPQPEGDRVTRPVRPLWSGFVLVATAGAGLVVLLILVVRLLLSALMM